MVRVFAFESGALHMKPTLFRLIAILGVATAAAPAAAATLDFSGDICVGFTGACADGSRIEADYGSIPGQLAVHYDRDVLSTTLTDRTLSWWNLNYSDLQGVAWGGSNNNFGRPEIFLQPLAGFGVTVTSFQLGAWPNTNRTTQVSVLDGFRVPLFESDPDITIIGTTASTFSGPWTSAEGIRIQWGPNGFNVGIDNIVFDVFAVTDPVDPVAPIPLPAAGWMLLSGVGALAAVRRARR